MRGTTAKKLRKLGWFGKMTDMRITNERTAYKTLKTWFKKHGWDDTLSDLWESYQMYMKHCKEKKSGN